MYRSIFFITILVILYTPLAMLDYAHFPYSDGAEHGAAVRELAQNLSNPSDPLLADHPGNSPRFVPSTLLMALAMRVLHCDVLIILKLFLILYFLLFLVSVALFSKEYFNDGGQPPWSIVSLLFLWGAGWMGANAYMFSAILYTAYFPSVVSFSVSLLAFYFQLRFLHTHKPGFLLATILSGSFAFANHPPTGIFFFICSGLLYLERKVPIKKAICYYCLSVASALFLASFWPYYSFLQDLLKTASGEMARTADYQLTRCYLYSKLLIRSGPALIGIPFLILFLLGRRHLFLTGGFIVFSFIYFTGYFFQISLAERFIFFIMFTLHISLSRAYREWFPGSLSLASLNTKKISAWLLVALLATGIAIQTVFLYTRFIFPAFTFTQSHLLLNYTSPNQMQRDLARYLRDGDVVLSDIYTSWSIPVFTGAKIIALYHTPPHVRDNQERINALEMFYNPTTTNEERWGILKHYRVTHILLNFQIAGKDIEPAIKEMGCSVITQNNTLCLFSVHSNHTL